MNPIKMAVRGVRAAGRNGKSPVFAAGDTRLRPSGLADSILSMSDSGIESIAAGSSNWSAKSIVAGVNPARSMSAGYLAAGAVGGMYGMMADPDNKGWGFAKGAAGGMIGGKAFRTFSRNGAGFSNSLYKGLDDRLASGKLGALSRGWNEHKQVIHKGLRGFHSTQGRNNMFRSGAMLGGGAFGVMFASNGKSHRRGFNSRRGNGFSR